MNSPQLKPNTCAESQPDSTPENVKLSGEIQSAASTPPSEKSNPASVPESVAVALLLRQTGNDSETVAASWKRHFFKPVALEKIKDELLLAKFINESYEASQTDSAKATFHAMEAIKNALLCGQALLQAKENAGARGWRAWVAKHCPQLSVETTYRYMRVASMSHVTQMDDLRKCQSLRQLYIMCGILPEPEATPANDTPQSSAPNRFITWLGTWKDKVTQAKPQEWPPEERAKTKAEMIATGRQMIEYGEAL